MRAASAACVALLLVAYAAASGTAPFSSGTYCAQKSAAGTWSVTEATADGCPGAAAWAQYNRTFEAIGWDTLQMYGAPASDATISDADRAYGVGFLEGVLTADRCELQYYNQMSANGSWPLSEPVLAYMQANYDNMAATFAVAPAASDAYLSNVYVVFKQMQGIMKGASQHSSLTQLQVFALSFGGDAFDIKNIVNPSRRNPADMPRKDFNDWLLANSRCSALFKATPTLDDVWFGHTTWANFNMMLRIFKRVTMNFANISGVAAQSIAYSSFPGDVASTDDFYITSAKLAVIETSLSVFNMSIYDGVCNPTQLLSSVRVMVANRMASSGPQWVDVFSRQNSGTYNNEWLVLDMNLITPGSDFPANTFTLADQMPGKVFSGDLTRTLSAGYVPSYNVPYFKAAFELAGFPGAIAKQGPHMLDYATCARADIFRDRQTSVSSPDTMQHMMQYNQFETDPLELNDSIYAIAARGDKRPQPRLFGGLDTKFSSVQTILAGGSDLSVFAYSGPTPQQGAFAWANTPEVSSKTNHRGLPDVYNFTRQNFMLPAFW
mmetsp:Transcript_46687/g.143979  ORF Transcript_46687/g.143979 Transcript_46687/m.143979 type:complete len:550 (-) Transcript_46687:99-1748(-)|eukprot:CAMPEP_0174850504 /NCGR_PEP_ID=MMETSP1114-20130205/19641_1 /TAXON_ID=312471 /ORGANISM="Neobodo designis, Strain CCAP 1951/1" /LENGTH=549 /DNA_ID=CAMNT_0016084965 /DNA_START=42 /DNA_END=1688 /DNA_ORIENTATION=+